MSKQTISEHIRNVFEEAEPDEKVFIRNFRAITRHGAIEGETQLKEVLNYPATERVGE